MQQAKRLLVVQGGAQDFSKRVPGSMGAKERI